MLTNLRFADDISVLADNVDKLQEAVRRIQEASREMGICINVSKTEIQYVGKEEYKFQIGLLLLLFKLIVRQCKQSTVTRS